MFYNFEAMKKEIREILSKYRQNEGYTMEDAERELFNLFSDRTFTCTNALKTIIKWNEYDKNGTDNRAPHKDECIGVICKATLEKLK